MFTTRTLKSIYWENTQTGSSDVTHTGSNDVTQTGSSYTYSKEATIFLEHRVTLGLVGAVVNIHLQLPGMVDKTAGHSNVIIATLLQLWQKHPVKHE